MKVVGFVGSPRKGGNTEILVRNALDGAAETGAETEIFYFNDLSIRGCQGCGHCKKADECAIDDDMTRLYDEIKNADAIVVASPVYMFQMTGQTKIFFDRFYALLNADYSPRFKKGTPLLLGFAFGNDDPEYFEDYFKITSSFLGFMGFNVIDTIVAPGVSAVGDVSESKDVLQKATKLGKELVS